MTDRELMQMALDALEEAQSYTSSEIWSPSMTNECAAAAEALRAALAQPEQEPVAWMEIEKYIDEDNLWDSRKILRDYDNGLGEPLYTAPPQREWQGLTDEEIVEIAATPAAIPGAYVHCFARAIEAKLREKNG